MLRRSLAPKFSWHSLSEFASAEADAAAFRVARAADTNAQELIDKSSNTKVAPVDWKKHEDSIRHKDLVSGLKEYHDAQLKLLDSLIAQDHTKVVNDSCHLNSWDGVYKDAVSSCKKSVEASEKIVSNGAKALYISYNNPAINEVTTSEWLDTDQYWASFVEKHHFYHNHINSISEDPESKEYDDKVTNDMLRAMKLMDDQLQNKLLYQRPSYEYYHVFHGPLIEHMIFYLSKTGSDARLFPELMPHKWFCEIYDIKFKILEALQKDKINKQIGDSLRVCTPDYHPKNLEADGSAYYSKLISKEGTITEALVGKLMGNYMFLSDAIPAQTIKSLKAVEASAGVGQWYTLGDAANALFYKPSSVASSPIEAVNSFVLNLEGDKRYLPKAYEIALKSFCDILESRKTGLGGAWFNLPQESIGDAFLRRLKKTDPCYDVYSGYVSEMKDVWKSSAKAISGDEACKLIVDIEKKILLENAEADRLLFDVSENTESKAETETILKHATAGKISNMFSTKEILAFDVSGVAISADLVSKALPQ